MKFISDKLYYVTLIVWMGACVSPFKPISFSPPTMLIIGLDGVGYSTFKSLQDGGHFRDFKSLSPMVASFPSISDPNWALIAGAPMEESFTKEHFDISAKGPNGQGKVIGSLLDHLSKPPTYESYFDFRPEGSFEHLANLTLMETTGLYWLDSMEKKLFETQNKSVFSVLIINTDYLAHTQGEKNLMKYLVELDDKVSALRKKYASFYGRDLEVVLVSDHGNRFVKPSSILPQDFLEKKGWHVTESISGPRDVSFVFPEILSFAAFFCREDQKIELAKTLSGLQGVHVALASTSVNSVDIFSEGGINHTRMRLTNPNAANNTAGNIAYELISGKDPLHQLPYFKKNLCPSINIFSIQ